MKIKLFAFIICCLAVQLVHSQSSDSDKKEVREIIDQLFDAMREGDSLQLKSVLHDHCRLMTVYRNKEGQPAVSEENVGDFVKAVGVPHNEVWDERISKVKITVDGDLAQAWMNYEFFLDDQYSHKGVNAFQFVRTIEGWKVIQITDTRRK